MTQQDTQPPAETLAECPFCGGSAQLMGFNAPEFWVSCLRIGCKAGTESFGSKERAVAAWNRRTSPALTRRAGGDAIGQSDGDPDGWLAVKVNGEGGIVMPYGPLHAGPDRPNDSRYRWAPFYIGDTK